MANNPLHICIVTGDFPGLTETFVTNKVLELSKRGHRITVIKNNKSGVNKSHLKLVKDAGIEILEMPSFGSVPDLAKRPATFLRSISPSVKKFKSNYKSIIQSQLLNAQKFDVVHFEFSGIGIFYLDAIRTLKCKTVVSCRGTAEKVKPLSDVKRKHELLVLFDAVDKIHCVSTDMAETAAQLGASTGKLFVNRPSIDVEIFKRATAYQINSSTIRILSIGRLTFQKGYLVGLLAMQELKRKGADFTWKIVGDGPQHEELLFHINALQLCDNVELLGKQNRDEILALYNQSDIFFLPSVYEGIANVCLEAMSMQLPVVSSDCSGMREVITHEVDGMLATNYNYNTMAECLQSLCNSYEKRVAMGKAARNTIAQKFTLEKQVDIFEEQYTKLVTTKL